MHFYYKFLLYSAIINSATFWHWGWHWPRFMPNILWLRQFNTYKKKENQKDRLKLFWKFTLHLLFLTLPFSAIFYSSLKSSFLLTKSSGPVEVHRFLKNDQKNKITISSPTQQPCCTKNLVRGLCVGGDMVILVFSHFWKIGVL